MRTVMGGRAEANYVFVFVHARECSVKRRWLCVITSRSAFVSIRRSAWKGVCWYRVVHAVECSAQRRWRERDFEGRGGNTERKSTEQPNHDDRTRGASSARYTERGTSTSTAEMSIRVPAIQTQITLLETHFIDRRLPVPIQIGRLVLRLVSGAVADGERGDAVRVRVGGELGSKFDVCISSRGKEAEKGMYPQAKGAAVKRTQSQRATHPLLNHLHPLPKPAPPSPAIRPPSALLHLLCSATASSTRQNGAKSRHTPAYPSTRHPRSFAKAKNASNPRGGGRDVLSVYHARGGGEGGGLRGQQGEDESELEEGASESGPSIGGGAGCRNEGGGGGGGEGEEESGDRGFRVVRHVEVEEV
ncbi:hypothetical protein B0H13DRAFT_2502454 [Mycena leptocephala]|nr:hypothetical protein B0H13DRAFT_2502454 [Mycena leptocephala]